MDEALPLDERKNTRGRVPVYVEVESAGGRRTGYSQDLSVGGFFLPCRPPLAVGTRCRCVFFVAGPGSEAGVAIEGRVARNGVLGCAIAFDAGAERGAREQLQRVLLAYADDPTALQNEFRRDDAQRTGSD
jgi:hypothetical protein